MDILQGMGNPNIVFHNNLYNSIIKNMTQKIYNLVMKDID